MNVYDFDKTIYNGDSTIDFFLFTVRKKPAVLKQLPATAAAALRFVRKQIDRTEFKECFFSFLNQVDAAEYTELFWQKHERKICQWYRDRQREDDTVISASPVFLLAPVCKKLGIRNLIASDVDLRTGRFASPNCKGKEKVRVFREKYPDAVIDNFYSDSESDLPMAREAKKAFLVRRGKIREWETR